MVDLVDESLYQSKYNYYKIFNLWTIIICSLTEIVYFISDCQLFGRFAYETLVPRCFILIPMLIFIIFYKKITNYKIIIPLSYITIHSAMWCTIWSIYYLPIKTHASEGFIIMHLMFLAVGLCAPPKYSILFHSGVILNIVISNLFNHYENLDIMLSLGIPCLIGIEAVLFVLDKVYKEHYLIKKQLEESVYIDQLTKTYNRNILSQILEKNTNNLIFENAYLMILDIDFFKKINDTYGHEKGDTILVSTANNISKCISKDDYLIRWGGEEFVVILSNSNKEDVIEIAKSINKTIEEHENNICKTTISIGIAKCDSNDYHKVIVNADKALYEAKENGRNQYIYYENE